MEQRIKDLEEAAEWQGNYLHNQLGFVNKPDAEKIKGAIWKKMDDIKGDIHGNGGMGIKTKVILMWRLHSAAWFFTGGCVVWIIKDLLK